MTLAILLAAAQTMAAAPPLTTSECVAVQLHSSRDDRPARRSPRGGPHAAAISASRTIDVELGVRIRSALTGDHLLRLKLLTPGGYLYQTLTLPFRFDAGAAGAAARARPATLRVPGFPRPLPVQSLAVTSGNGLADGRVTARLPVAGTSISLDSLFGRWRAVPYLDDRATPCGPAGSFVIEP